MQGNKKFGIVTVILLVGIIFLGSLAFHPKEAFSAEETYKVGILQPFTGALALYTKAIVGACEIAADEINQGGGILGRKVELLKYDTKTKVDVGVRGAKELILRNKADVILGPCASSILLGVIEVTKEYETLHISTISNTEKASLEKIHPYYFQTVPNTYMETSSVAEGGANLNFKKYITFASDYEWGHSSIEIITKHVERRMPDAKMIKQFWPKLGEIDFTSYITSMIAADPDFVFSWIGGQDLVNFLKQGKSYGFFEKVPAVVPGFLDAIMDLGPEFPENVYMYNRAAFYAIDTPQMRVFENKFREKMGRYPTAWAILAYDSIMCLRDAIKKAGSFDKDAIASNLEEGRFNTLRGELYFRAIDHMMNSPMYFSKSQFDKTKGFCIGKDVQVISGEKLWRTEEEIKKIRAEKGIVFKPWHEK